MNPRCGSIATAVDPQTWGTFAETLAACKRSDTCAGVGFAFSPDDPFCGIDIDSCLDETGDLLWGADVVEQFDTYTEISPSGRGVKLFLKST